MQWGKQPEKANSTILPSSSGKQAQVNRQASFTPIHLILTGTEVKLGATQEKFHQHCRIQLPCYTALNTDDCIWFGLSILCFYAVGQMENSESTENIKKVHPRMKMRSSFRYIHVVPNLYDFLFSVEQKSKAKFSWMCQKLLSTKLNGDAYFWAPQMTKTSP